MSELTHKEHKDAQLDALDELKRFQVERGLHKQPFDKRVCTMNIIEELFELWGVSCDNTRGLEGMAVEYMLQIVDMIKAKAPTIKEIETKGMKKGDVITFDEPTDEDVVDALCDIQTFAGGDNMKLGYDNKKCLLEVGKEINSREGEIIEGKFQKFKTEEAMAKWYKANFSECKL